MHKSVPYGDLVRAGSEFMKLFQSLVNDQDMPECCSHEAWGGKDAKAIEKGSGLFNEPVFGKPCPRRFPAKHDMQEASGTDLSHCSLRYRSTTLYPGL